MISIMSPRIGDIIQHLLPIQSIPFRNRKQPHRTKRALRVNVKTLAFSAAHIDGQLTCYCEGMTDLGFPRSKLAEDFGDGTSFDTASEERVELVGAGGDADQSQIQNVVADEIDRR